MNQKEYAGPIGHKRFLEDQIEYEQSLKAKTITFLEKHKENSVVVEATEDLLTSMDKRLAKLREELEQLKQAKA